MDHPLSQYVSSHLGRNIPGSLHKRLMILVVLLISIAIGFLGQESILKLILIFVLGMIGLALLIWEPVVGLMMVMLGGFFVSYAGPGGLNVSVIGIAGMTGLWLFMMILRERKIELTDMATSIPILVLMVVSVIALINGQINWYPMARNAELDAQAGGFAIFILSACAFILTANLVRDVRWLQYFTWLFVLIGSVYILGRLLPPFGVVVNQYFQSGATSNSSIFWIWILVIPFSQAVLNKELHVAWRGLLMMLVAGVLYAAIVQASDWKSGYLPSLAGVAAIVALMLRRKVVLFAPLFVIAAIFALTDAVATDEYSYITRMDAWIIVIKLAFINPIFGLGFANYYWYTPLSPIMGYAVNFNSHSQYVDLFAQTGILGVIAFFWVFWEIGRLGLNIMDRVPEGFSKAFVYGALGGIVGTLVAGFFVDWVLPFVYNIGMSGFRGSIFSWLFLGGLVTINRNIIQNGKVADLDHFDERSA